MLICARQISRFIRRRYRLWLREKHEFTLAEVRALRIDLIDQVQDAQAHLDWREQRARAALMALDMSPDE